jgi:hypothetical protein
MIAEINCIECGKIIKSRYATIYCSRQCSWTKQSRDRKVVSEAKRLRICRSCGKEFVMPFPSGRARRGEAAAGLYCSRKCRWDGYRKAKSCKIYPGSYKVYPRQCVECGEYFIAKRENIVNCKACKYKKNLYYMRHKYWEHKEQEPRESFNCAECGKVVVLAYKPGGRGRKHSVFCSENCQKKYNRRKRGNSHVKRARYFGVNYQSVDPIKVFIRDGWRCQLCHKKLRRVDRGSIKDVAPELDHIIPLSKGGEHSYRNTQCICRKCNSEKAGQECGQLRLFG